MNGKNRYRGFGRALTCLLLTALLFAPAAASEDPPTPEPTVVTGRVTDAEGKPVAGAGVGYIHSSGSSAKSGSTTTDEDGRYSLEAEPGKHRVTVEAEGFVVSYLSREVRPGTNSGWDLVLTRGVRVTGRVVDTQGKPQAGRRFGLSLVPAAIDRSADVGHWAASGAKPTDVAPNWKIRSDWPVPSAALNCGPCDW